MVMPIRKRAQRQVAQAKAWQADVIFDILWWALGGTLAAILFYLSIF